MASALTPPKKNTWRVLQILVVLLLGGCSPALTVTEITTQVHPVQPGQRIEIELTAGQVEVRGQPGSSLENPLKLGTMFESIKGLPWALYPFPRAPVMNSEARNVIPPLKMMSSYIPVQQF